MATSVTKAGHKEAVSQEKLMFLRGATVFFQG